MSKKIHDLYAMSDDEVIAAHDKVAEHTVVGTSYWMEELERRSRVRFEATAEKLSTQSLALARKTVGLTYATVALALISVIIAVVSLIVR